MSAFIVTKDTIDLILTAYHALSTPEASALHAVAWDAHESGDIEHLSSLRIQMDTDGTLTKLGKMLFRENYRSVNARYSQKGRSPSYRFQAMPVDNITAALPRVLGAIRCLIYQSCEHEGWQKSKACRWLDTFVTSFESRIPLVLDRYGKPGEKQRLGDQLPEDVWNAVYRIRMARGTVNP